MNPDQQTTLWLSSFRYYLAEAAEAPHPIRRMGVGMRARAMKRSGVAKLL